MSKGKKVRVVITVEENGGARIYDSGSQPSKSSLHDEFTAVNAVACHLCILFSGEDKPKLPEKPTWMGSNGRVWNIEQLEDDHLVNIIVNAYAIASKKVAPAFCTHWCEQNTRNFIHLLKEVHKRGLFDKLFSGLITKFGQFIGRGFVSDYMELVMQSTFLESSNGWSGNT